MHMIKALAAITSHSVRAIKTVVTVKHRTNSVCRSRRAPLIASVTRSQRITQVGDYLFLGNDELVSVHEGGLNIGRNYT